MTTTVPPDAAVASDLLDVLIVGAGISGIAAACHLGHDHPERSYAILEMRGASGGTWDLFRYPGIRSDSDLPTFGFAFNPWRSDNAIADGDEILTYIRETAREHHVDEHIRYHHAVTAADWDPATAHWTVTAERTDDHGRGEMVTLTASWLFCASGYYDYAQGFAPTFLGTEDFGGTLVHPQHWPEDLDYAGKRVLVIGSGATAVTLVPAMAPTAGHVTMLQRSPSYVVSQPREDPVANWLRRQLGDRRGYRITRRINIRRQQLFYAFCQRFPRQARRLIRAQTIKQLPEGYPVDVDFNPRYDPWDQRLCVVPGGDLFDSICRGESDIVTSGIDRFVPEGVRLADGRVLEADIVVTATGLTVRAFGGIAFSVDGTAMPAAERVAFRASMLSELPNLTFAIGYTNISWTLKVDLVCENLMRLLTYMDLHGYDTCVPRPPREMATRPLLDFQAGYILRAVDTIPKQGTRYPWDVPMWYAKDVKRLRVAPIEDPGLVFSRSLGGVGVGRSSDTAAAAEGRRSV